MLVSHPSPASFSFCEAVTIQCHYMHIAHAHKHTTQSFIRVTQKTRDGRSAFEARRAASNIAFIEMHQMSRLVVYIAKSIVANNYSGGTL